MMNLSDSLTEIDWLNSLRIKETKEAKGEFPNFVNNELKVIPMDSQPKHNGYEKPSYSYAYLIKLAIESSKCNRMKLNEIYSWIMEKYPYYKHMKADHCKGWKNAIRHNLSLNKVFKRCPKNRSESGKGSYWTIDTNGWDNQIQDPPMKKMKLINFNSKDDNYDDNNNIATTIANTTIHSEFNLLKSYVPEGEFVTNNSTDISITQLNLIKSSLSLRPSALQVEHKIDIFSNSFSEQSAFIPYSIHNVNSSRLSETSSSACEISYDESCDIQIPNMPLNVVSGTQQFPQGLSNPNHLDQESTILHERNATDFSTIYNSISQVYSTKNIFSSIPAVQSDSKIDNFVPFSNQNVFVPYSVQSNTNGRLSEMSTSTCEISYLNDYKYNSFLLQTPNVDFANGSQSNFSKTERLSLRKLCGYSLSTSSFKELVKSRRTSNGLEIDSDNTENGNDDIILKTPVLSQINSESNFKDKTEENILIKFPLRIGYHQEATETIFDTNNLQDSFFSIHHSLFESDSFDSRHIFPSGYSEKRSHKDISFPQNLLQPIMSQINSNDIKNESREVPNLFEGSLGLSANTKNILLNVSGFTENWLGSSQWFELNDTDSINEIQSNPLNANQTSNQDEIIPSQEFIEMKNHLRCHRYKNDSITESYKPSSVSTSSTLKSTDTVNSKSPACDKRTDVINATEVVTVIDQVSKSHLSEEEEDIEDCFNWGSFI